MDDGIQDASSKSKYLHGDTQRLFQRTSLYTCFIKTALEYKTFNNVLNLTHENYWYIGIILAYSS